MNQEYNKQAELAFAAYARNLVAGAVDELKLRGEGFSISQARNFASTYQVVDQHTDLTGLSATVFKDNNTGETFLTIRGTEITDVGDMLTNLINITLFGSTTLQPQYQSLKTKVQDWIDTGILPQNFTVTGHSLGGFLATDLAVDSTFANYITHAYLYNTPGQAGIFGDLINMMQNAWGIPTQYDPAKFSNIEAVVSDGLNIRPIAGLGCGVSPSIKNKLNHNITHIFASSVCRLWTFILSNFQSVCTATSKGISFLKLSLLFVFSSLSLSSMAQDTKIVGTPLQEKPAKNLLEVCKHQITDYRSIKIAIEKLYPVGSDVSVLLNNLENYFGTIKEKKIAKDYFFIKKQAEEVDNSWIYFFSKKCDYSSSYSVVWKFYVLSDFEGKITARNIQPILQTTELSSINVPFNFDFFENDKHRKEALWSLTGLGITKDNVLELMTKVGGEYGKLEVIKIKDSDNKLAYRYEFSSDVFIASRIAPWEFSSIVIWEFDSHDKLTHLIVR